MPFTADQMGGWERKEHSSILLTYSQVGTTPPSIPPHTSIPPEKNACWARPHPSTQSSKVTLELQICNIQIPYVTLLFLYAFCRITRLQSEKSIKRGVHTTPPPDLRNLSGKNPPCPSQWQCWFIVFVLFCFV